MEMSEPAVDQEDIQLLLARIHRHDEEVVMQNNHIRKLQEELQKMCDQVAEDHEKQLDLRFELLEKLRLLVSTTDRSDSEFQGKSNEVVGDRDRCFGQRNGGLQELEKPTYDPDFTLTELERLMTWQCERLKDLACSHGQLQLQERDILQQLQILNSEKSIALIQLQAKLDKLVDDHSVRLHQLLTESAEKDEANRNLLHAYEQLQQKLADSADRANKLDDANKKLHRADEHLQWVVNEKEIKLDEAIKRGDQLHIELMSCRQELRTSQELASKTKLRQLKDSNMTEEFSAIMSSLQRETASIAEQLKKQNTTATTIYSKDANETVELEQSDTKGSSVPDYLRRLQENYQQLTEILEARKVAALMFQHDALTFKELQTIQQCPTLFKAAEDLLQIIVQLRDQQVYDCFLSALLETNQQHIWSWLSYDDYDINSEHFQLIQNHYSYLVETIDAQTSGLLDNLFACHVIDTRDKDYLNAELSDMRRNEKLLSIMGRKPKLQFDHFLDCLSKTGYRHIVNKLIRGEESFDETDNSSGEVAEHPPTFREVQCSLQTTADLNPDNSSGEFAEHPPTFREVQCSLQTTADLNPELSLCHVILSDGRGEIRGVTVCNEKLFVLRGPSKERIQQYDVESFNELTSILAKRLSDKDFGCKTLASCVIKHCLYINDHSNVFRVDLSNNNFVSWHVGGEPCGLSVNRTGNVLVTCRNDNVIKEYTASGSRAKSIPLPPNHVTSPLHAVQLNDSRYVVCHYGPKQGVSLIDRQGRLIATYRNSETTQLVNYPRWIVVVNESILVADQDNNRIILLNSALSDARVLSLPVDCRLKQPCCMYLDQLHGRLYVGEHGDEKRVLVFGNVNF